MLINAAIEGLQIGSPNQFFIGNSVKQYVVFNINIGNEAVEKDIHPVFVQERFQRLGEASGPSHGILVFSIEAEIAEGEEGGGIGEKVLGDDVDQGAVFGEPLQVGNNRLIQPVDLPDGPHVSHEPGQQCFSDIPEILVVIKKERIVNAVQYVHVAGDFPDFRHDQLNVANTFRKQLLKHLLILNQALCIRNDHLLISNCKGDQASHPRHLDSQLLEHGKDDAGIFYGTDALAVDKAIAIEGVDQPAHPILLFTEQLRKSRTCTVGSCSQACNAASHHYHIIGFLHAVLPHSNSR